MDETDPILGERLTMGGRRGGKFKFAQDQNSEGDVRIMQQENISPKNCWSVIYFVMMIVIITFTIAVCAYITFTMDTEQA